MYNLNYDIIREISYKLNLESILIFSLFNKNIYNALDGVFYKNLAINYFGREFWAKAYLRPPRTSKPLKTIKKQLDYHQNFSHVLNIHKIHYILNHSYMDNFFSFLSLQILP